MASTGPNGPVCLPAKSFDIVVLGQNLEAALIGSEEGRDARVAAAVLNSIVGAPVFTETPSISTDGSPVVGEIVALDFGTIVGDNIGVRQIIDASDAIVATVSTGSYALAAAGTFRLRVWAASTVGLFSISAPIVVTNPVAGAMSAPTLSFPAGRVAGTNPPEIVAASLDGSIDVSTDTLEVEWDRNSTGTFVAVDVETIPLTIDMATAGEVAVVDLASLVSGPIRFRARFTRPGGLSSPYSTGYLADTLGEPAMPPASTIWDVSNKSQYITLSGSDLIAVGNASVGSAMPVAATIGRTDRRFYELEVLARGTAQSFRVGIMPSTTVISAGAFSQPTGAIQHQFASGTIVAGDKIVVDYTPNTDIKIYVNSVLTNTITHTITDAKITFTPNADCRVELNTGQAAFDYTPSGSTRWN